MPILSEISDLSGAIPFLDKQPKLSRDKINFHIDRAIQKSLSFRVFATLGTFAVTYAFTGNIMAGVGISTAQALTNTTIYYIHEKMWDKKN